MHNKSREAIMSRETTKLAHRLDAEIFNDARLTLDTHADVPRTVHVQVDNGTVTLTGGVRWPSERSAAESAVRQVHGVRRVLNLVTVDMVQPAELGPTDE